MELVILELDVTNAILELLNLLVEAFMHLLNSHMEIVNSLATDLLIELLSKLLNCFDHDILLSDDHLVL